MRGVADADIHGNDASTEGRLAALCFLLEDVQKVRIGAGNRGFTDQSERLKLEEDRISRLVKKELAEHPMYDWLPNGMRGAKVAMLLSIMRDPARFPNKSCLQSYFGLGAVHGRAQRRARGVKANYNVRGKTILLGPKGIADQIVLHRVQPYRDMYDAEKARLLSRGGDGRSDGDGDCVEAAPAHSGHDDRPVGNEALDEVAHYTEDGDDADLIGNRGLNELPARKTGKEDQLARKIVAKAFLRDLWREWKNRCGDDLILGNDERDEAA